MIKRRISSYKRWVVALVILLIGVSAIKLLIVNASESVAFFAQDISHIVSEVVRNHVFQFIKATFLVFGVFYFKEIMKFIVKNNKAMSQMESDKQELFINTLSGYRWLFAVSILFLEIIYFLSIR